MATIRDQNGKTLTHDIRREDDGTWGCTVWFGGWNGFATNVRRYHYRTREQAEDGDISDDIGQRGRVG
jgi:hypothetical protein